MSTRGLADHHLPETDLSVVGHGRHAAASNADQQAEPEIGECYPCLGGDRSRGDFAWLEGLAMKTLWPAMLPRRYAL